MTYTWFMPHKSLRPDMLERREPIGAQTRRQPADTLFTATHAGINKETTKTDSKAINICPMPNLVYGYQESKQLMSLHTHTHTTRKSKNIIVQNTSTQSNPGDRERERAVICKYSSINILEDIYIYIYSHIIKKYFFPSTFQFYSHLHDVSKISKMYK